MSHDLDGENDPTAYSYKPSLFGAPWQFRLAADALEWQAGMRAGRFPYADIRRVRLSFRPVNMQTYRFLAEIWPLQGPKVTIASSSWRSMIEQSRQDAAYSTFVTELHRRIAAARGTAAFDSGSPALLYWPGLAIFAAVSLALAALTVKAMRVASWAAAALVGGLLGLFLWQAGTFFRRNRPGRCRPDALPRALLP